MHIVKDDTPVYAKDIVEYFCDPVLMVVGPDKAEVERLALRMEGAYEPLHMILDVRKAENCIRNFCLATSRFTKIITRASLRFLRL